MKQWYYRKMLESDSFTEAKNYASMAGVEVGELIRLRYLMESTNDQTDQSIKR